MKPSAVWGDCDRHTRQSLVLCLTVGVSGCPTLLRCTIRCAVSKCVCLSALYRLPRYIIVRGTFGLGSPTGPTAVPGPAPRPRAGARTFAVPASLVRATYSNFLMRTIIRSCTLATFTASLIGTVVLDLSVSVSTHSVEFLEMKGQGRRVSLRLPPDGVSYGERRDAARQLVETCAVM